MSRKKKLSEELVISDAIIPIQVDEKKLIPEVEQRTVVDSPGVMENARPVAPLLFMVSTVADTITPWGTNVKQRDIELRQFTITEPVLSSAVYSTSVRNASFEWEIVASEPELPDPKNTRRAVTRMLVNSNRGLGWKNMMLKTCSDLYQADNGAFWEVIRAEDSPTSPVLNLAHLDSGRCYRTGDPEIPVIYMDRYGVYHYMKWYQVITIEEFPSPVESLYGVQVCAVTRALRMAQILRDIEVFKLEKVSGRWARSIDLVGGISRAELEDAFKLATAEMDNQGLTRFNPRVIIPGIDPTNAISHETIDLASLPDAFSFDEEMKWYISILAMAFGVDYQEFAPLPSGAMGSGQQSEILHMKTRGKGPAMIMGLFEHILNNNGIIPSTVKFQFLVHDSQAEESEANARFLRGKDRALRVQSGELDIEASRQVAVDDGDMPDYLATEMKKREDEAEREAPPPVPQEQPTADGSGGFPPANEGGDNLSANNIETGTASRNQRKQENGGMRSLPDKNLPIISDDEVESERKDLGKYLLGAN
jgi:hypothetical protein